MNEADAAPLDDQCPLSRECGQCGQHGQRGVGRWAPGQSGDTGDTQGLAEGHNSGLFVFVVCQSLNIFG